MTKNSIKLPDALRTRLQTQLGDSFPVFEQSLNTDSPVSVRINPNKSTGQFIQMDSIPWCSQGVYLPSRPNFTKDPLFHAGTYYVQEASSMFLAHIMEQTVQFEKDLKVLDLSAAPGGKSTLLQTLISNDSLLVANEIISSRNKILRQNMTRWGGDNHFITQSDPKQFRKLPEFFDVILVDAPCSGEGLIRKDPHAINEWSKGNVSMCAARQKRILADIVPSLAPSGILIYSTCTYSEEENEENMAWLESTSDLEPIQVTVPTEWGVQTRNPEFFGYRFYPHEVKGEGFFMAAFRKVGESRIRHGKSKVKSPFSSANKEDSYWLENPERYKFITRNQHRIALPKKLLQEYLVVSQALWLTSSGINMGKVYPNGLKPSAELALSQALSTHIPRVEIDKEQALDYLAHLPVPFPGSLPTGRHLVSHAGFGLGWLHRLKTGQTRNNYPAAWRILKR